MRTIDFRFDLRQFDVINQNVSQFPIEIADELQQGYLEKAYQPGLEPDEVFHMACEKIVVPNHTGDTLTRTKPGLLSANEDPVDPSLATGLNNGMTNEQWNNEQYTVTMELFNGTQTIDIKTMPMGIVSRWRQGVRAMKNQSVQSIDLYRRNMLLGGYVASKGNLQNTGPFGPPAGYLSGTTIAVESLATTTTIHVDDVSGFTFTVINGVKQAVSGGNPLGLYRNGVQIANVIGYTLDLTNPVVSPKNGSPMGFGGSSMRVMKSQNASQPIANSGRGASGNLLTDVPVSYVAGDVLSSAFAPKIIYPNGKNHFSELSTSDGLNEASILAATSYLRDNKVPSQYGGLYGCVTDNQAWNQLYADSDFKEAFQTRGQDEVYSHARLINHLGVAFTPSSNAAFTPQNGGLSVSVRWVMIFGAGALVDAPSEINGTFAGVSNPEFRNGYVSETDGICSAIRPPIDSQLKFVQASWESIRGATVPTDLTANGIVTSASNAYAKRCVIIGCRA